MLDIHDPNSALEAKSLFECFIKKSNEILSKLGIKPAHAETISLTLGAMYSATYKHYHTYAHVMDLFDRAERFGIKLNQHEQLAILFHDVVYVPGHKFNEPASVEFMMTLLYSHEVHSDNVLPAAEMIRHTAQFFGFVSDKNSHRVLDIDLSTLASTPYVFARQNMLLEREYPGIEPGLRAQFLKKFLDKQQQYYTMPELDPIARSNIAGEVARLEALASVRERIKSTP